MYIVCEIGNFLINLVKWGILGGFPNWEGSVFWTQFKEIEGPGTGTCSIINIQCFMTRWEVQCKALTFSYLAFC